MKKLTGFIVKLLPLGLLLGLCIALSGCGKMQRINLNDLMSYEITGYSGQGKLTWDLDSENYDYYIGNFDTIDTLPEQLFGWDMGYGYRYPDNAFTSLVLSRTDEYKHDEMVLE